MLQNRCTLDTFRVLNAPKFSETRALPSIADNTIEEFEVFFEKISTRIDAGFRNAQCRRRLPN